MQSRSWRFGASVALTFLLCFGLSSVVAQLKAPIRITAVHVSAGAEGARVTIAADSPLNDTEAFRRGDRFYVRIPAAEFVGSQPALRGEGFEDVQIQKIGDGIVISFKLETGANARVDEAGSQLHVLFSSPTAMARNNAKTVRSRVISASSRSTGRGRDAAGPVPPGSPDFSEAPEETLSGADFSDGPARVTRRSHPDRVNSTTAGTSTTQPANAQVSPTPYSYATPIGTPWSSYPATTTATPVTAPTASSASATTTIKQRAQSLLQSVSANRKATIIGGALVLAIAGLAVVMFYRRGKNVSRAKKRVHVPRVEPKLASDFDLEMSNDRGNLDPEVSFAEEFDFDELESETTVASGPESFAEPATASTRASFEQPWSIPVVESSPVNAPVYTRRDEQEREVFEL